MTPDLDRFTENGTNYLTGGQGPPVVFLHGIPGSALTWKAVARRLQRHDRVILPDLPGFGQSESPVGGYYMEGQARAIRP